MCGSYAAFSETLSTVSFLRIAATIGTPLGYANFRNGKRIYETAATYTFYIPNIVLSITFSQPRRD